MGPRPHRRQWHRWSRLSGLTMSLLVGLAAQGEPRLTVSVSVAPEAPCVTAKSLVGELEREGLSIVESGGLDVDVSASAPGIRLRARRQDDGRLLVRGVPAGPRACDGVERALVTLIREWASTPRLAAPERPRVPNTLARPSDAPAAAASTAGPAAAVTSADDAARASSTGPRSAPAPATAPVAAPVADAPAAAAAVSTPDIDPPPRVASATRTSETRSASRPRETRSRSATDTSGSAGSAAGTDTGVASGGSGVASATEPPPPAGPLSVPTPAPPPATDVATSSAEAAPPPAAQSLWQVRLGVGGGVSGGATPVVPAGIVTLDVGSGALGASLDGALEGAASTSSAPGQLTTAFQWLTLSARWRFTWLERVSLDLGLGVRGSRLTASATGFTTNGTAALWSVGPAATLSVWVRVLGPLHLMLRTVASYRLPEDRFEIAGGPRFTVGAWQLGSVLGVAVAWP